MIILELSCGLGNQMFQYAMARKLQQQRGDTLAFNLSAFSKDKQRDYSLNHFNILTDVIMLPNNKQKVYRILGEIGASILNKMHLMKGEKAFYWVAKHGFFATFDVFNFYGNYKCNKRRIYIRGFFQSEKYFQDIEGIIKDEFKIITPIQNKNINILEKIKNVNSVCVHIRRGDYISNPIDRKNLDVCSEYYYKTSMREMARDVEKPVFFIFSNSHEDIEWIQNNYKWDYPVEYVDQNNDDYEELRLMINCKHFIISNSTFSWWAQYLSENIDKKVFAPSIWYRGKGQDDKDIYMKNWTIIDMDGRN